jgi:hypothetical protein
MDLGTVENNLNNGVYKTPAEFHAHVSKIWENGYTFNYKGSYVHKLTVEMEKCYKSLLNGEAYKKAMKNEKKARIDK